MDWELRTDRPIYTQLLEELKLRIIMGQYKPASKVPSVRELATEAAVNPNTMQKALSELESEGLMYSQRTAGRFITEDVVLIESMKKELVIRHIKEFFNNMIALGYEKNEIASMITQEARKE